MTKPQKLTIAAAVLLLAGLAIYFERRSQAASMPALPVTVGFHHALLGRSMVAVLNSSAPSEMAVIIEVVDAASHGHRSYRVNVGPARPTDFGHLEGYAFEPGDLLTLSHDGYRPVSVQVP